VINESGSVEPVGQCNQAFQNRWIWKLCGWWQDESGELGSNRRSSATQNRSKEVKESGCVERMDKRNQAFPNQK
jgi:hypothetical protein